MNVVRGRIVGGMGPFLILAWTKVDGVSMVFYPEKSPAPRVKAVTMKSSRDKVMASKKPLAIPGMISGSVAFTNA